MIPTQPQAAHGEALARSQALTEWFHELIGFQGPIGADIFMRWALYHPEYGYYNHLKNIGRGGDFVTAPTLSPVFAQSLAAFYERWQKSDDATCQVLEIGAGTGALAKVFLAYCQQKNIAVDYTIYEPSPSLRVIQQQTLPNHITWLDDWPEGFSGLVIANEVLDALPAKSFKIDSDGQSILERVVASENGQLLWQEKPIHPMMQGRLQDLPDTLQAGQCFEVCFEAAKWTLQLSQAIEKGMVLLFDYGEADREFFSPHQPNGSLRAFYEQQVLNDILWQPGLCDITTDVNFTELAISANAADFDVLGLTTQAYFMLENQVDDMLLAEHNFDMKTLLMPGQMGERFKVMVLGKGLGERDIFSHDLRHRL